VKKKTTKTTIVPMPKKVCKDNFQCDTTGGAIYGLGFIGSLVYYISTATGFWNGVLGVLKAIVWPAFLMYEAFKFLGA
jgi:hypothetical protein